MSLTRSPVTSSNSRFVGASMVHSLVGIPPVLPVGCPSTPNDISHSVKVKMYRVSVPEVATGPGREGRPRDRPDRYRTDLVTRPGGRPGLAWSVSQSVLVVVEPGQPAGQPVHGHVEAGVDVDEVAEPLGEPRYRDLFLAA